MANLGGMQRVALKLHQALAARSRGNAALDYDSILLRSSWRWVHIRTPLFLVRAAVELVRAARRDEKTVVLFSSMVTAALTVPLQGLFRRHGIKTAAITHGLDVTTPFPPYQWFVPKIFGALDAVLPVSRATAEACLQRGATATQVHVVPNGIDVDRFEPPPDRSESRTVLRDAFTSPIPPSSPDSLLLCSVGRQVRRKGTAWFVDQVMPILPPDVHYWIAGTGPEDDNIQAAIDRHDLGDRVRRLGRIPNDHLAHLYRGADLFVMPNIPVEDDLEGFGIVLLEAGQCGTPAIAAQIDGIQDVITEGVNGHLVDPQAPAAFREAILQYRNAPARLSDIADRARTHTVETFSWPSVADRYLSALETLEKFGTPPAPVAPHSAEGSSARSS